MSYRWALVLLLVVNAFCVIRFAGRNDHACQSSQPQQPIPTAQTVSGAPHYETLRPVVKRVGRGTIEVSFAPGSFDIPEREVLSWVTRAAEAVSTYYGRFPVTRTRLRIVPVEGETGVFRGTTYGQGGGFTRVPLGQHVSREELRRDWVLTHEFVHLAFPDMPERHAWIEEGIATYVEPIARVQAGQLDPRQMWSDLVRDMPKGQPASGDKGLDNTHTWARTYWGGAMFCMVADIEIRRQTNNEKGLQDALKAILDTGGTLDKEGWSLLQAFRVGDRATGTQVLEELYKLRKDRPVNTNLPSLWFRLGVRVKHGKLTLNNSSPWADTRAAITIRPESLVEEADVEAAGME